MHWKQWDPGQIENLDFEAGTLLKSLELAGIDICVVKSYADNMKSHCTDEETTYHITSSRVVDDDEDNLPPIRRNPVSGCRRSFSPGVCRPRFAGKGANPRKHNAFASACPDCATTTDLITYTSCGMFPQHELGMTWPRYTLIFLPWP